jgi:glutamate racemase
MRFNPKMIVVACNTASAVALPGPAAAYAPLPVIGVVEPGCAGGSWRQHAADISL